MPTTVAMALASVVSLLLEDWLQPYVGLPVTAALSLVVWCGVFYPVRRWLLELRNG